MDIYNITDIQIETLTAEEFAEMDLRNITDVRIFKITNLVDLKVFESTYKDKICSLTTRGNTLHVMDESPFSAVPQGYYAWEDIDDLEEADSLVKIPMKHIPIRVAHIYKGGIDTGTHIHYHNYVVNYLIKGKKLWVVFPHTENNKRVIDSDGYIKTSKQRLSTKMWLIRKKRMLTMKIKGLQVIIQNEGEVLCLPDQWFHIVLNLEHSVGITYSW